ncbi:DUF2156 domain-containing protein [Candidatus Woesearchaeota archaeon]|nr:DUF2156 domain-containing protein [Candidatus Woesearchaeota archaeon]
MISGLKPVTLADKEIFEKFFARISEPIADTTFLMRYIWAEPLRHSWTVIDGSLCVFGFLEGKYVVWGPPVGGKSTEDALQKSFEVVEKLNSVEGINAAPAAIYIPECLFSEYQGIASRNGWRFDYWTQDYIYRTADLVSLAGKKYHSKRRELNIFTRNNNAEVEKYDFGKHGEACLELISLWRKQKEGNVSDKDREALDLEVAAARKLIESSTALHAEGIVVKVGGKLIGLAVGEKHRGMFTKTVQKTDFGFRGASEFILRELARHYGDCEFLNAEDDFGVEYLKQMKLAYYPERLLKSYLLEKK